MLCFIIALRSKAVSSDWENVVRNFNNTLHSIYNQTSANWRIYVGYTDMPRFDEIYDQRLIMIHCNNPIPTNREEKLRDRGWKISVCANAIYKDYDYINNQGGVFVFPVDADDLINRRIVSYVDKHSEENGFHALKGYKHYKGSKLLHITKWYGGSMNIMKLKKEELMPVLPDVQFCYDTEMCKKMCEESPVRWTDLEVESKFRELGRPLKRLPFKSTIYCVGTGDNISDTDPQNISTGTKRIHPIKILRLLNPFTKRLITRKIKKDFGIKESGFNQ